MPAGNHHLTVSTEAVVYGANRSIFFIDGSSTAFFSTSAQPSHESPSSYPSPTQRPTYTPAHIHPNPLLFQIEPILLVVFLIAAIAVLIYYMEYYRKKKIILKKEGDE